MKNKNELNEDFFRFVYRILQDQDRLSIEQLKYFLSKSEIIKQSKNAISKNLLFACILYFYFLITNNKLYQEIDKKNIEILLHELKTIIFYGKMPNFPKIEDDKLLTMLIQLLEYLNKIDSTRIDYIEENANIGRTIASTRHLFQIELLLEQKEQLETEIKRTLSQ